MSNTIYVRKSVYALSEQEKTALRDAFRTLYTNPIAPKQTLINEYPNQYQQLSAILNQFGHYQWNDLLFLPWARAYFWWFEQALRSVSQDISLPYWDYTSDEAIAHGLPDLFTDKEYVTANGETQANPLLMASYKYPFVTFRELQADTALLQRAAGLLPEVNSKANFVDFSLAVYPIDILSHSYLGGSSANTHSTSYDPVFWFTHCQLDHMWWQWQEGHKNHQAPVSVLETKLMPFTKVSGGQPEILKGANVMHTAQLGYTYE